MRSCHLRRSMLMSAALLNIALVLPCAASFEGQATLQMLPGRAPAAVVFHWQSRARLRRGLRHVPGTLTIDSHGVEFSSEARPPQHWTFTAIKTFKLTPRRFSLTDYENRGWRRPGDRQFRFELAEAPPPAIARELAEKVEKPSVNGVPGPNGHEFAEIPARHGTRTGGTNGLLRFGASGIDYVTGSPGGGRSWRWADIETIASPSPYRLRVQAYRETFEFELKQPLTADLFNRLWDCVYARGLQVSPGQGGNIQ